jgi:transcription termination factor Rho
MELMRRSRRTGKSDQKRHGPKPGKPQGKTHHAPGHPSPVARPRGRPHHAAPRDEGPAPDRAPRENGAVRLGETVEGVLELHPRGYGFLRDPARNYAAQPSDPYVPAALIQQHHLREGLLLTGPVEAVHRGTNGPRLARLDRIEGAPPDRYVRRNFDDLTPVDPHEQIVLETGAEPLTTRVMDLLTPIGKGQRGLIVAPPRTGKTILLQHIAQAVAKNHPEMHLIMLLIDERPEEVTEMRRTVRGEVVASSSDRDSTSHARLAELVMERAKRLAEQGKQVFVLLDSITRLGRAYNRNVRDSGRTMSGGIDIRALEVPRRLFGSARVLEEGGSVTVIATALIDTGSRMDEYIFQEFKGTGNMELVLDRKLSDRRVFPAMDITASGTRKEERLLGPDVLPRVTLLRRSLVSLNPVTAMESLVKELSKSPSNAAFLERIKRFAH